MKLDRFSASEREACVLRIKNGEPIQLIAQEIQATESTIYRWIRKYDGTTESLKSGSSVPHTPHPKTMPKEEEERLIAIVTENPYITDKKLSELLGTNRSPAVLYRKRAKLFGERKRTAYKYDFATMFDESKVNAINLMDADQGIIPKEFYVIETVEGLYIRMDEGHYPACLTPYFTVAVKFQTEAEADEFCQTLLFEGMRWRPHTRCVKGGVLQ